MHRLVGMLGGGGRRQKNESKQRMVVANPLLSLSAVRGWRRVVVGGHRWVRKQRQSAPALTRAAQRRPPAHSQLGESDVMFQPAGADAWIYSWQGGR